MISSEGLNSDDEVKIRKKLDRYLNEATNNRPEDACESELMFSLRRFRAKLKMREMKRQRHLKLFDIDSYTNELIDREQLASKQVKENKQEDEDVIFEFKTLKTNMYETSNSSSSSVKPEIIEVTRVLDRFKSKHQQHVMLGQRENFYFSNRMPIGMVEWRNEDVKCIFSPFTNKMLKPYIWRDFKSKPARLEINNEIRKRIISDIQQSSSYENESIDYVHLRPEHVLPINMMCEDHFWNGIDISECLQYPDLTIVALYKKLIIGFAFLTPPSTSTTTSSENKEMYLSFIFVHPDWREAKRNQQTSSQHRVSIAQYMLYYLIKTCNCDIILHVSVNSPAVILYQKFGFQIEEFIQDFYDKYYSSEQNLSKDAFLMKLSC